MQAWPPDQPRSWLAAALRSCAASLRRAAGDALWAGGPVPGCCWPRGRAWRTPGRPAPRWPGGGSWPPTASGILGPAHPDTLAAGGQLAAALLAAGQAAEAVTWFGWLHSSRASMLGPDHPATIAAQVSLGRALIGRRAARSGARRPGRGGWPAASGPADPATPGPWPRGNSTPPRGWPRARPPRRSACTSGRWPTASACTGPDHPGTVAVRLRLADALLAAGKTKDAIAQHKAVLAGREHALGPDHPDTLAARAGLAAAYDAAGQMGAALQHHQEACAGYERVFGADHPDTLARRADLARAYCRRGPGRRGGDPAARHHRPQRAGPVPRRPADPVRCGRPWPTSPGR